jgi:hypothetical protein
MSANIDGGTPYKDIYDEKYDKESDILLKRLFKTDRIFTLDGFLLKRYIEVLIKIFGYRELEKFPAKTICHIDKNGFSLEIADYLNNANYLFMPPSAYYSIIISPEQQNARLLYEPFSFSDECANSVYKKYGEIIKFITKDDAAVIEYKFNLRNFDDISKIHRLRSVTMSVETAGGRVADIARLKKMIEELAVNDNILSDAYVSELMDFVQKTGRGVKNILNKAFVDDISAALQSFYIQYPHMVISLFDAANKNTLLFYNPQDYNPPEEIPAGLYPVAISPKNIIDNLESLKFIDYHTNPSFIIERAELFENLFLLEKGFDVNKLSKFEISRAKSDLHSAMPDIINNLHELKGLLEQPKINAKKEMARQDTAVKFALAFAKSEFNIVNKLLCLFDKYNYVRRYYSDIAALEREITQMPPAKKYYILNYLAREVKRSDVIND